MGQFHGAVVIQYGGRLSIYGLTGWIFLLILIPSLCVAFVLSDRLHAGSDASSLIDSWKLSNTARTDNWSLIALIWNKYGSSIKRAYCRQNYARLSSQIINDTAGCVEDCWQPLVGINNPVVCIFTNITSLGCYRYILKTRGICNVKHPVWHQSWLCNWPQICYTFTCLPYRMKIYTEFNLAAWLRMVKSMELNISKFWILVINKLSLKDS